MLFSRYKFEWLPAMQNMCIFVIQSQLCIVSFRYCIERTTCRNLYLAVVCFLTASLPIILHSSRRRSPQWHRIRNRNGLHKDSYLLTPWNRVLLEKLASLQLVKKFPTFYGTRSFLTALTSARHLSLSWASPIQSSYPNPISWRSIPILSSHLRLGLCNTHKNYLLRLLVPKTRPGTRGGTWENNIKMNPK